MIVELDVTVVNAAMECVKDLNAKPGNSMEKSTGLINIYNALSQGITEMNNKIAEKQRATQEEKKQQAEKAAEEKANKGKKPVKRTGPELVKEATEDKK